MQKQKIPVNNSGKTKRAFMVHLEKQAYVGTGAFCCYFKYAILSSKSREDDSNPIINVSGILSNYLYSLSSQGL